MIHYFSIQNYQSIRDEVVLNFRIPNTTPEKMGFRTSPSRPDYRLPTVVAIYGANGSGKTTLLRGLTNVVSFAADSFISATSSGKVQGFVPFYSDSLSLMPTVVVIEFDAQLPFEADIYQRPQLCRYSLVIERDAQHDFSAYVAYESIHIFPKGRPKGIMIRRPNEPVFLSKEFKVGRKDARLSAIHPCASAISMLAAMQVSCFPQIVESLHSVNFNVAKSEPWNMPDSSLTQFYRDNPSVVGEVADVLRRSDLGIENMQVEKIQHTGKWILVFEHQGLDYEVPFIGESSGTRQIVRLFPLLNSALNELGLAVMDALDSELHTELTLEVLNWFRRYDTNPNGAQLICALHNPSALDEAEKEEIYFVEKNRQGATTCYGAKDISGLRRDVNLNKQYRSGTLGGVPTFG